MHPPSHYRLMRWTLCLTSRLNNPPVVPTHNKNNNKHLFLPLLVLIHWRHRSRFRRRPRTRLRREDWCHRQYNRKKDMHQTRPDKARRRRMRGRTGCRVLVAPQHHRRLAAYVSVGVGEHGGRAGVGHRGRLRGRRTVMRTGPEGEWMRP